MNIFSGQEGCGSVNEKKTHEFSTVLKRGKLKKNMVECIDEAGSLPGRVQLLKSMSSMATCPSLVKLLEASNRMVKS